MIPMWNWRRMWEEMEELRREVEEAMERFSPQTPMWDVEHGRIEPLTEIRETRDSYVVTVDLPMVRKEDIDLEISEDSLRVRAKMRRSLSYERWGTVQRTKEFKTWQKTLRFPGPVDAGKASATFKKGVLIVEVAKKEESREIEIR